MHIFRDFQASTHVAQAQLIDCATCRQASIGTLVQHRPHPLNAAITLLRGLSNFDLNHHSPKSTHPTNIFHDECVAFDINTLAFC